MNLPTDSRNFSEPLRDNRRKRWYLRLLSYVPKAETFSMKYLLGGLLILSTWTMSGQSRNFEMFGTVVSNDTEETLESATVYLEREKDSSLVTYTISDRNGRFFMRNQTAEDSLKLYISFVGYKTFQKKIAIDREKIELGTISMEQGNQLDEVVITSRAPVTIKKDTLEFNVSSFKTRKDATVEDLLKLLPGVEVDPEGGITVNGKPVNRILVNGKPFFGDDPTIATRNLTKEIIEKVQVTDTKTEAQAFSGEEGDTENKTINLTIDEENNKGVFGRVAAGAGTDERYEYAGLFNFFDNDLRLSVLAGGNNINSPGFSFGEIRKMLGGARSMSMSSNGSFVIDGRSFGGSEGLVTSNNAGANFADELGKNLDVSADYFFSETRSNNETTVQRENIFPDARFFTDSKSRDNIDSDNHTSNLRFNIKIDSTWHINIRPALQFGTGRQTSARNEESRDEQGLVTNTSIVNSMSDNTTRNFTNGLDITRRFGSGGGFFSLNLTATINRQDTDRFLNSETRVFGDDPDEIIRDQFTDAEQNLNGFTARANYRIPLKAESFFLDLTYHLRDDTRESIESTFDFDEQTQDYTLFNTALSTNFEYINRRNTPGISLRYQKEKWSLNANAGYVFRTLESRDKLRPQLSLKEKFQAVEYGTRFNYRFSPKRSIYTGYNLNNNPPDVSQLQPFQDVTDPLNIVTGNPNLEPANTHRVYAGYNSFDFQKGTGFYSYLNASFTNNQVVPRTTIDENFVRNTTYINVDGYYSLNASINNSKSITLDSLRTLKIDAGVYSFLRRNVNFNNDIEYASRSATIGPSLGLSFSWKDVLLIEPRYVFTYTTTRFNIDDFEDQDFARHEIDLETRTFLPKQLEWRNNIVYNYNPNVTSGFQKSVWFWNSTLAYSMLKDRGILTLKVYDLLNQNNNTRRSSSPTSIQDVQSTVLQQYFMLSFSWKFNTLGKKGEPDGGNIFFR